jgi:hypothetical protein
MTTSPPSLRGGFSRQSNPWTKQPGSPRHCAPRDDDLGGGLNHFVTLSNGGGPRHDDLSPVIVRRL